MVAVCEPLQMLTSSTVAWTWNTSYQAIYVKAKLLIKADACMKYYDENKPLETAASGVGLGAAILQTLDVMACQKDAVPDSIIL